MSNFEKIIFKFQNTKYKTQYSYYLPINNSVTALNPHILNMLLIIYAPNVINIRPSILSIVWD